jgi:hypothetical protein
VVRVVAAGGTGYALRTSALRSDAAAPAATGHGPVAPVSALGDLSVFRGTTQTMLDDLARGDQSGATAGADELEVQWDDAEARLKPRDTAAWTGIDGRIDRVLREVRAAAPDPAMEKPARRR